MSSAMTPEQRLVWERRIGTIGVAWTEKHVEETIEELSAANPLHFECAQCECKWQFHTQEQLDMLQRHMNAHFERFNSLKVQAALSVLSLEDRVALQQTNNEKKES